MKTIIQRTALMVMATTYCHGQYFSNTGITDAIMERYYKQSNAAVNSGFAYKTQAAKNRDLQAISNQLPGLRADAHYSPQHRAALEAAEHGYNQVLKTPVDPSGGQGAWGGDPQQRLQEAMKWQQQFIDDYKNLQSQIDQARQQARQQMAKDNAYYDQKRQEGLATLNRAGSSGLDMLDALDAKEKASSGQANTNKQLEQSLIKAIEQEIADELNAMGGTWNNSYALGGSIPGLLDPQAIQGLQNLKDFLPLDPNDFGNPSSELDQDDRTWPKATTHIPRDADGHYIHPNNAPWGTYYGDTICDGGEGITGPGRDAAIAEFERLTSDDPENPKYAPAFHYPDDVLSSVTGIATGPTRQRAIEEYEKKIAVEQAGKAAEAKAASDAEEKYQAIISQRNSYVWPPPNNDPNGTDLPPKPVRTDPLMTSDDEPKKGDGQTPGNQPKDMDWEKTANNISIWWKDVKDKPRQLKEKFDKSLKEKFPILKESKDILDPLSSPNQ